MLPQEYTTCNVGDFRLPCLIASDAQGAYGADFVYVSHSVSPGKYALDGLPCAHEEDGDAETLTVRLKDPVTGLTLELLYGVFAERDIITRAARLINEGPAPLRLEKAASACLDLPFGEWDLLHFHGRHAMERQMQRVPVGDFIQTVSSTRGHSSHHHNPFFILCDRSATETAGLCYGVMLVYSGSFRMDVERSQTGAVRVVSGIHEERFCWILQPGERFDAPEVLLSCAADGLTALSQQYHRFLRKNICRGPWRDRRRPVLINNWEATYFDFNTEKIVQIAEKAASLGVEMMVLDDGWFGARSDDNRGLGDWTVNCEKLPGGLDPLIERIHGLGMKFGLWIEPEMVNEDSDLYRAHPDWALTLPGRSPAMGRNQLVLDFSRPEVVDHLTEVLSRLLREHQIEYIKWDMNRSMSDVFSRALPPQQQGEVMHRSMLGVYRLAERLTQGFPEVLFEGCAGGGGRFDAGMLCYFPQIWCSDDTDAIERLTIQHGTSFGYPVCTMGAHVSACPNHQTGRTTPIDTRAVVAMSGTFGYELDLGRLSRSECAAVKRQIKRFQKWSELIRSGDYFRLSDPTSDLYFTAWQFTAPDRSEALLNLVVSHPQANALPIHVCFRGLEDDAIYQIDALHYFGAQNVHDGGSAAGEGLHAGMRFSGSMLRYAGLTLPQLFGDFPSVQIHLTRKEK
ncbi:MAG: alpha-galactosidase [Faecalibacterium sp.]